MSLQAYLATTFATVVLYDNVARALPQWCHSTHPGASYRAVNAVKGAVLGAMSIPSIVLIGDAFLDTEHAWWFIPYMSTVYASLDMAALLVLDAMHTSTTVHHTVVQLLHWYLSTQDYGKSGLARPIVVFACFSCLAFLANVRLALREYPKDDPRLKAAVTLVTAWAHYVYIVTCVLNTAAQLYLVRALWSTTSLFPMGMYIVAAASVFNDDLVLIAWLSREREPSRGFKNICDHNSNAENSGQYAEAGSQENKESLCTQDLAVCHEEEENDEAEYCPSPQNRRLRSAGPGTSASSAPEE
jgi:hypothetical protein